MSYINAGPTVFQSNDSQAQQTLSIEPIMDYFWPNDCNAGPPLAMPVPKRVTE